ncbi:putative serine/threonine-protein kinase receptor [Hordeum vulgare]|nr:putative serine/threonine-protein kinase receptor [Hordeum vulgare]
MSGPSHVQGSQNLTTLKQHMESELGYSAHILEAWKECHKGKHGTEFCSQSAQERYKTLREVFQEVHWQDAEPTTKPLDPELLIIAGEGKGHGRHLLCNEAITTSSHRKLHEIRASSTSSTPSILSRPTAASRKITHLKISIITVAEEEQRRHVEEQRRQTEEEKREKESAKMNESFKLLEKKLEALEMMPPPPLLLLQELNPMEMMPLLFLKMVV